MLHNKKICFLFVLLFALAGNSYAENWGFSGGAGVKYQTVDFEIANISFSPLFVSNSLNFTAFKDNFYMSVEHDISTKDHQELTISANEAQFINMGRTDTNFTVGFLATSSLNVFAGYKLATLNAKLDTVLDPDFTGDNAPRAQDVEFKDSGFYVGASYTQRFGDSGALSYSAAYADMDGEVSFTGAEYDPGTNTIKTFSAKTEGTTSGISLGITWSDSFSESSTYNVAFKVNLYEFEDEALTTGENMSTKETFTILSIGLSKYF
ncbi:MAG: hypothetical protein OEY67_00070 [Gammaproteobacteria bacterium]|nr:hypothetical protein [Gammaproteobacteria bacterium]